MNEPIADKIAIARRRLTSAIEAHRPTHVFGLFSGGHDSFSACFVASGVHHFNGVAHINTGWGVEATREYVRETCAIRSWSLREYKASENVRARDSAPDPQDYASLVRVHGFPGPHGHGMMYQRLKERQLRRLERDCGAKSKDGQRIMYVSGCRSEESDRRMGNTDEVQIDGRRIWCAPIHDWSKLDTTNCLEHAEQPRNPVVDLIHKSGECLCGAFAKKGELEELNIWDITRPAYLRIKALEAEVVPIFGRGWGERPRRDNRTREMFTGPLCWGCDKLQTPEVIR